MEEKVMLNEEQRAILQPIFERIAQKTGLDVAVIKECVMGEPKR